MLLLISCLGSAFINSYSKTLLSTFSPAEVLVYSFSIADLVLLVLALSLRAELIRTSVWYWLGRMDELAGNCRFQPERVNAAVLLGDRKN